MAPVPAFAPRILPAIDDHNRGFWTGGADGTLHLARCEPCRRYVHPPRRDCSDCGAPLTFAAVSGDATLYSYTVAHQQFHPDVPTPFVIALVEIAEQPGLRLVTNIVDCDVDSLTCGMALRVRFEEHGEAFVPVFAPA
ncbi:OB-fold domain-containing protein [Mycobacterium sp. UM_Kg1]|uniref:Zn-ribbon domain-containing OB-fold protein n=1 Tax=Mycobacterium sp. UM_Kg1 TaxID=1545691 RepID=UPI00061AACA2|nr:OB-fold domain-containing protein [Mycobacterium sp. UM_Kg1]